jgi:hypothetical protein
MKMRPDRRVPRVRHAMLAAALLLVACGDDDNPIDNGGNGGIG